MRDDGNRTPLGNDPAEVEKLAKELQNVVCKSVDEAISKTALFTEEFERFFLSLHAESDRALAIVTFSYIDEELQRLLVQVLNPNIVGGTKKLFDAHGPLATASSRIELVAALYWIDPRVYKNLRILRKIRNAFAHDPFIPSFDDSQIQDLLNSMIPYEQPLFELRPHLFKPRETISNRMLYHVRAAITCKFMISEIAICPIAQRLGLDPMMPFARNWESLPESLRLLEKASIGIAFQLIGTEECAKRDRERAQQSR